MTSGSIIRDTRSAFEKVTVYSDGSYLNQGTVLIGPRLTRDWTGANWPAQRPSETTARLALPSGRVLTKKLRNPVSGSVGVQDHSYTTAIVDSVSTSLITRQSVWTMVEFTQQGPRFEWRDTVTYSSSEEFSGTVTYSNLWDGNDDIALVGKLREKIAGSDFNMAVFLGEGREALKMLAGAATTIYKSFRAVKRGDIAGAASILKIKKPRGVPKNAAGSWLQLQYGWLPLVQDAHSSAQFLAKQLEFPACQTYKVRRGKQGSVSNGASDWIQNNSAFYHKQIIARISEVDPYKLAGLTDPLSVAWELLPFSFIADWFIPIGNYLSARSLASALTGVYVTTGTYRKFENIIGRPTFTEPGVQVLTYTTGGYSRKSLFLTRDVSTTIDVGRPSFKLLSDVPSWKRAANAVALVIQMKR